MYSDFKGGLDHVRGRALKILLVSWWLHTHYEPTEAKGSKKEKKKYCRCPSSHREATDGLPLSQALLVINILGRLVPHDQCDIALANNALLSRSIVGTLGAPREVGVPNSRSTLRHRRYARGRHGKFFRAGGAASFTMAVLESAIDVLCGRVLELPMRWRKSSNRHGDCDRWRGRAKTNMGGRDGSRGQVGGMQERGGAILDLSPAKTRVIPQA
jgi:hypothetical protein